MQSFLQIGEMTWEEFKKVGLQHFASLQKKKNSGCKWAWPIPQHVDIRFLNVRQSISELQAKMKFLSSGRN